MNGDEDGGRKFLLMEALQRIEKIFSDDVELDRKNMEKIIELLNQQGLKIEPDSGVPD